MCCEKLRSFAVFCRTSPQIFFFFKTLHAIIIIRAAAAAAGFALQFPFALIACHHQCLFVFFCLALEMSDLSNRKIFFVTFLYGVASFLLGRFYANQMQEISALASYSPVETSSGDYSLEDRILQLTMPPPNASPFARQLEIGFALSLFLVLLFIYFTANDIVRKKRKTNEKKKEVDVSISKFTENIVFERLKLKHDDADAAVRNPGEDDEETEEKLNYYNRSFVIVTLLNDEADSIIEAFKTRLLGGAYYQLLVKLTTKQQKKKKKTRTE